MELGQEDCLQNKQGKMAKPNMQIKIDEEMEKLIVETTIEDFHNSEEARKKINYGRSDKGVDITFDSRIEDLKDMWYGRRKVKTVPWRFCSNRSMRIGMAILEMLHARMFAAVWNEDLIRFRAVEKNDVDKVERITKFMGWWIKVRVKMRKFFDGWTKIVSAMGDATVEGSWEVKTLDKGETTTIPIVDENEDALFNDDGTPKETETKLLTVKEKTRIDIIPKENVYLQEGQKSLQDEPVIIKMKFFYSDLEEMEAKGQAVNVTNLLRNDIMTGLETQFAGQQMDDKNKEIIKEVKLKNTPVVILKQYLHIDIDRDGFAEDVRVLIDPDRKIYLGGILVRDLTASGERPLSSAKFNDYIDRIDELDGLGVLETVKPLSDEMDAIFNQMTDANTLSVLRPFFYDPGGDLKPANITIAPNKGIPVTDPQRNVFFPDFQIATERLLVAMRTIMEFIERLTGASSYVMGKESEIVGGSGTATRTTAIIQNAEQRFSQPAQRLRDGASDILRIVLDLVQKNLPPGLDTRVLGEDGESIFGENELTKEGIKGEFDVYILGDATLGSKQLERDLSVMLYSVLLQNPITGTDPIKIYTITADLLKAHGKEPEKYLGPAPEPKDFDSPEDENTLIMQGDFNKVRAIMTENHLQHAATHQVAMNSPTLMSMDPAMANLIVTFTQSHIQEHMQMLQQLMTIQSQFGGAGGTSNSGVGGPQGGSAFTGLESLTGPGAAVAKTQASGTVQRT